MQSVLLLLYIVKQAFTKNRNTCSTSHEKIFSGTLFVLKRFPSIKTFKKSKPLKDWIFQISQPRHYSNYMTGRCVARNLGHNTNQKNTNKIKQSVNMASVLQHKPSEKSSSSAFGGFSGTTSNWSSSSSSFISANTSWMQV